jgi:hypothetical protein
MQKARKQQLRLLILDYQKKQNWKNQKKKKKKKNRREVIATDKRLKLLQTYPEIHENKKNEVAIINKHENYAIFFLLFYFFEKQIEPAIRVT